MKRFGFIICVTITVLTIALIFAGFSVETKASANAINVDCRAMYLIDADTGTEMQSLNADERYPIASMVKIMTALIAFNAIESGEMTLDEMISISENSSGMGGSQMFLDTGLSYSVSDLMKGIVVASANDACVAIAERLAGSEEAYVDMMNKRAKDLGMSNTHFANCTGLPAPGAYSSAKDVAKMTRELVKCKDYYTFSKIWLEDFKHPDGRTTVLTNTNKLVRFYAGCDGGKTGYTSEAKFCLAATAIKNDMRVISVVIGSPDSKTRFADSRKLLDYAFATYKNEVAHRAGEEMGRMPIINGKQKTIPYGAKANISYFTKRGVEINSDIKIELRDLKAPVKKGDVVGVAYTLKDDKVIATVELVALEGTEKASYGDFFERILGEWSVKRK